MPGAALPQVARLPPVGDHRDGRQSSLMSRHIGGQERLIEVPPFQPLGQGSAGGEQGVHHGLALRLSLAPKHHRRNRSGELVRPVARLHLLLALETAPELQEQGSVEGTTGTTDG